MTKVKKHKWKYRIDVRKKILVLVVLGVSLFVGLGYAALGTTLGIAGIFTVGGSRISVSFDNNVNLLGGLEDASGLSAGTNITYSISNGIVTFESNSATGYGYTDIKSNLVAGKTYIFNCETDGEWAWKFDDDDAVYGFLGQTDNDVVELTSNKNFEFTVEESGEYKLRIDVHEENGTRTLSNIRITEKNETTKYVVKDHTYGELPEPVRKNYIFEGWSLVPSGYQQVEYIESTAGNYIATDYYPSSDTKIVAKYNFTSNKSYAAVFGTRGGSFAYMLVDASMHNTNLYLYYGNDSQYSQSTTNVTFGQDYIATIEKGIASIPNFEDIGATDNTEFQMNYPLYIFTFNEANSILSDYVKGGVRVYYMKIYENNTLVKELVPVVRKSDNEAGLYDTMTDTFYGKSGSGSFIVGNYSNDYVTADDIVEVSSNHMLTAVWRLTDFMVTFDANGGSIPSGEGWEGSGSSATKDVTYGMEYGALPTPTKEGYTFAGWGILENKYQQVEYVENNGSKYIDTGVKMDSNKAFDIKFKYTSPTGNYITALIVGSYDGTVNANALSYHQGSFRTHTTTTGQPVILKRADTTNTHVVNWNAQTNQVGIDGGSAISMSPTGTSNNTWYLFGGNYDDGLNYSSQGRIYYMKIYDDGNLIRDFIPAVEIDTGIVGVYDRVNKDFHPGLNGLLNAGSVVTDGEPLGYIDVSSEDIMEFNYDHILTALWTPNDYTVTLDANGGDIPATDGWTVNGSGATKTVTYDSTYGQLPIPTRSGYTFKGWHGKNLFKKQGTINVGGKLGLNVTYDDVTQEFTINGTQDGEGNIIFSSGLIEANAGQPISLSVFYVSGSAELAEDDDNLTYAYSIFTQDNSLYVRGDTQLTYFPQIYTFSKNMIGDSGGQNKSVMLQLWNAGTVFNNYTIKLQIEEGNSATRWEPYYVEDTTTVVRAQDHTLTAIWQED